MKILFATSEAQPLIKTGGLADVSGSLPTALKRLRQDVRLVLPAYPAACEAAGRLTRVAELTIPGADRPVGVLQGRLPGTRVPVYLIDSPLHFQRAGDPYRATDGRDWQDNDLRFALFARAVAALAMDEAGLDWRADILHCNDWQTGLAPALLHARPGRPATVFTIHNLSYQGLFPAEAMQRLGLPAGLWGPEGLEFYGRLSFIKGGLVFADRLTTVSPTYAREIQTPEFGYGLDGLLRHRGAVLRGILNGIDCKSWDPARDPHLPATYGPLELEPKRQNKRALQAELGLPTTDATPLLGHIGRLVEQKGIDLILQALPPLLRERRLQLAVLGSGEAIYEEGLRQLARAFPEQVGLHLGYNEALAHRIEAGADIFLMPSRFEPCGLNQMYSLRYGTPPVARRTGGLADTVADASESDQATGFLFDAPDPRALRAAIERALALYAEPSAWRALQLRGMQQDHCWEHSARDYLAMYKELL